MPALKILVNTTQLAWRLKTHSNAIAVQDILGSAVKLKMFVISITHVKIMETARGMVTNQWNTRVNAVQVLQVLNVSY